MFRLHEKKNPNAFDVIRLHHIPAAARVESVLRSSNSSLTLNEMKPIVSQPLGPQETKSTASSLSNEFPTLKKMLPIGMLMLFVILVTTFRSLCYQ